MDVVQGEQGAGGEGMGMIKGEIIENHKEIIEFMRAKDGICDWDDPDLTPRIMQKWEQPWLMMWLDRIVKQKHICFGMREGRGEVKSLEGLPN